MDLACGNLSPSLAGRRTKDNNSLFRNSNSSISALEQHRQWHQQQRHYNAVHTLPLLLLVGMVLLLCPTLNSQLRRRCPWQKRERILSPLPSFPSLAPHTQCLVLHLPSFWGRGRCEVFGCCCCCCFAPESRGELSCQKHLSYPLSAAASQKGPCFPLSSSSSLPSLFRWDPSTRS